MQSLLAIPRQVCLYDYDHLTQDYFGDIVFMGNANKFGRPSSEVFANTVEVVSLQKNKSVGFASLVEVLVADIAYFLENKDSEVCIYDDKPLDFLIQIVNGKEIKIAKKATLNYLLNNNLDEACNSSIYRNESIKGSNLALLIYKKIL